MIILLLLLSAAPYGFSMLDAFGNSVVGTIAETGITAVDFVVRHFMI